MDVPRRPRRSKLRRFYESDKGQIVFALSVIALICGGFIFLLSRVPEDKLHLKPENKMPVAILIGSFIIAEGLKAIASAIKGKQ